MPSFIQFLQESKIDIAEFKNTVLYADIENIWLNLPSKPKINEITNISGQISKTILKYFIDNQSFFEIKESKTQEYQDEDKIINPESVKLRLTKVTNQKLPDIINSSYIIDPLIEDLQKDPIYTVVDIKSKEVSSKAKSPFSTSTLQQAASSKLGLSPKTTMQLAQILYEGVEISKGNLQALITYMRTDSVNLSNHSLEQIHAFLNKNYPKYTIPAFRKFSNKSKNSQEAHEAIRPVDINITPSSLQGKLDKRLLDLYRLIWQQTVASQMADEKRLIHTFTLQNNIMNEFTGSQSQTSFLGWKAILA
jgi:DNA topoisomerase I